MSKEIDLTGNRYGRLVVVEKTNKRQSGKPLWLCKCDCGNETLVLSYNLRSGKIKSCKCFQSETRIKTHKKHGMSKTRLYAIWCGIRERCNNPNSKAYCDYGSRGVKVCDEWDNDFVAFYEWAIENGYSEDLTIDRINVNGDYEPSNCRWSDYENQQNNRRNNRLITYKGETHTMSDWAKIFGINYHTLATRLNRDKLSFEEAISKK